jgi:selenocysteine lyase/cysteine desulfurase
MLNLNLHDLESDFYATSPHKWLNAPPGTGVLYIRNGMLEQLWPTVTEVSPHASSISVLQARGQQCTPAFACLNDLADFQEHIIGKDRIQSRILALSSYLKERIRDTWGEASLFSPTAESLSSGIVSFNPFEDHFDAAKAKLYIQLKEQYKIIIRRVDFKNRLADSQKTQAMRASTHIFNSYRDVDKLISCLQELIAGM